MHRVGVDARPCPPRERLPRELEQDATVGHGPVRLGGARSGVGTAAVCHASAGSGAEPVSPAPTSKRAKRVTVIARLVEHGLDASSWSPCTEDCSVSTTSLKNPLTRPSTILGSAASGLPSSPAVSSAMRRSDSTVSAGTSSRVTYIGRIAAICMAVVRGGLGVGSPVNSTSTPTCGGQVGGLLVQVGRDLAVEQDERELELLADDGGEPGDVLADGLSVLERVGQQVLERRPGGSRPRARRCRARATGTPRSSRRSRSRS